jgi:hypothetical protein
MGLYEPRLDRCLKEEWGIMKYHTNEDMDYLIGDEVQHIIDMGKLYRIPYDRLIQYINKQLVIRGGLTLNEQ